MDSIGVIFEVAGGTLFVTVLATIFYLDFRRASYSYNLKHIPGFRSDQHLVAEDGATALAIDDASQQICLMSKRRGKPAFRVIAYKDVLSSEIIEDGNAVMRSSRSSQLGGAIVGGILTFPLGFGVVGALVGGLTGKKVSDDIVNRLDLALIINDTNAPRFTVNFLNVRNKKSKAPYKNAMQRVRHWHSVCAAVIKRGEVAVVTPPAMSAPILALPLPPLVRFFLYINNEVKGPYVASELKLLCDVGTADRQTMICKEGSEEWGSLGALLG